MTTIKVENQNGVAGYVDAEHWADPRIFMMDFQVAENAVGNDGEKFFAGDTFPKFRENLEFLSVE